MKNAVKAWAEAERRAEHSIFPEDVMKQFEYLASREVKRMELKALKLDARSAGVPSTASCALKQKLEVYKKVLDRLNGKAEANCWYRYQFQTRLVKFCDCLKRKTQYQTKLSPAAEAHRVKCTWKSFDKVIHEVGMADVKKLKQLFTLSEDMPDAEVLAMRDEVVIGFSDQVPWWGMSIVEEELHSKSELKSGGGLNGGRSGRAQTRGQCSKEGSHWRVTLELRHVVKNWFGEGTPQGSQCEAALVVPGVHCRLDNISDEGKWLEDEEFWVGSEKKTRVKGQSARGAMKEWVEIRRRNPEFFRHVKVYSQPSAVVDSVISSWFVKALALKYPLTIWCRDLAAGAGFNEATMKTMKALGAIGTRHQT